MRASDNVQSDLANTDNARSHVLAIHRYSDAVMPWGRQVGPGAAAGRAGGPRHERSLNSSGSSCGALPSNALIGCGSRFGVD